MRSAHLVDGGISQSAVSGVDYWEGCSAGSGTPQAADLPLPRTERSEMNFLMERVRREPESSPKRKTSKVLSAYSEGVLNGRRSLGAVLRRWDEIVCSINSGLDCLLNLRRPKRTWGSLPGYGSRQTDQASKTAFATVASPQVANRR